MKKDILKIGMVLGIIMLFVGTSVIPSISGNFRQNLNYKIEKDENYQITTVATIGGLKNNKYKQDSSLLSQIIISGDIEIDFTQVDYGTVYVGISKLVGGDLDMMTPNMPTIKNIGDVPVRLQIMQDDMQFGKTQDVWNVMFGARLGAEGELVYYYPEETIILSEVLEIGETNKLDFYINVIKAVPGLTYYGNLWLTAVDVPQNQPPTPPDIQGRTGGSVGEEYCWTFTSTDPDGDDIYYYIDWGDGYITTTDCFPSGTTVEECHTYSEQGSYIIKAKAVECPPGTLESDWSTLTVTMPVNQQSSQQSYSSFLIKTLQKILNLQ